MGLFKNIDLIRFNDAVGLSNRLTSKEIESEALAMSRKHLEPVLGIDLITKLETDYIAIIAAPASEYGKLIIQFERCLYFFIADKLLHKKKVQLGAGGITTQHTENSKPASQQEVLNLKETLLESAFDAIEYMLEFLEKNVDDYPEYKNSDTRKEYIKLFLPSAKIFSDSYKLEKQYQTYLHMIPTMKVVEELYIEANISTPYFEELKQKLEDASLTAADKKALLQIRKIVANYTIYEACISGWAKITSDGVFFTEYVGSVMEGSFKMTKATIEMLNLKTKEAKINAELFINKLVELLKENPTDYPTYTTWRNEKYPQEADEDIFCKQQKFGCKDEKSKIFW